MTAANPPGWVDRGPPGVATRTGLVLGVLLLGSLPPGLLAASGRLGRDLDPLRWAALFAPAVAAAGLLLLSVYFTGRGVRHRAIRLQMGAAGAVFLVWCAVLAAPPLVFPRLSAEAARLLGTGGDPEVLRQRAMLHPDPRRRLQAAWSYYLRTGEAVPFLDGRGRPVLFEPSTADRRRLGVPAWLVIRPGALDWERRALALGTTGIIVLVLAALPVAAALGRRHEGARGRGSGVGLEAD